MRDDHQTLRGYRVDRIEIRNFGGYHGPRSVICTDQAAMIFAGHNGSGKTTALDALRLLFNQRPAFNSSSSQTGARDRDVVDYYLGRVKHLGADAAEEERASAALRGYGLRTEPTGILAVFRNGDGRVLTAARLLHVPRAQDYRWRNVIIPGDVSLTGPLAEWLQPARFREEIEAMGGACYDTFDAYISALGDRFGLHGAHRDRAFKILDDAVSQRGFDSLEVFARRYILPESGFAAVLEDAEGQIAMATGLMEQVERAKTRLALLSSVSLAIGRYRQARTDEERGRRTRVAADLLRNHLERRAARMMIRGRRRDLAAREAEILTLEREAAQADEEARRVEREIDNAGGGQIDEIRDRIRRANDALIERGRRDARVRDLIGRAGLRAPGEDREGWDRVPDLARKERERLEALIGSLQAEREDALRGLVGPEAELEAAREDLASLERRRSAMPRPLLDARAALAEALDLREEELPFLGELIQIREGQEDWEGVANRVLGAVARNLMIPEDRYEEAKRALSRRHWGTKVVLQREDRSASPAPAPPSSLAARLEARADSPFRDQVLRTIAELAPHDCVDEEAFGTARGRAVTRSGAVQSGTRAEKDDRKRVDDPSGWVLGWSVEPRRRALQDRIGELQAEVSRLRDVAEQALGGVSAHQDRVRAIGVLLEVFVPHSEVDRAPLREEIARREAELERILSGGLKALEARKRELERARNAARQGADELRKRVGALENVIRAKEADLLSAREAARALPRPTREVRDSVAPLLTRLGGMCEVTGAGSSGLLSALAALEDAGRRIPWGQLSAAEEEDRERLARALLRAREGLSGQVAKALREFPEERQLSDRVFEGDEGSERALEDWLTAERDLRDQGIPELEQAYRDKLDEVSVHALAKIAAEVAQYRGNAHKKIRELNEVLIRAVYNPVLNSCAQFRIRRVADPLVSRFEADLKEAISGATDEERNLDAVQRVIGWVRDQDDPRKRAERARLLDLANWYQVDLEELERLPDGQPGDRLNLFDVPANQSGGEKQRLMAILFGAGVAHMFGTNDPDRSGDALGLMLLDEAFSNLDPEAAEAAASLLRQLGLQIIVASPLSKIHSVSGIVSRMQLVSSHKGVTRVEPVLMREHLSTVERNRDHRQAHAIRLLEEEGA